MMTKQLGFIFRGMVQLEERSVYFVRYAENTLL